MTVGEQALHNAFIDYTHLVDANFVFDQEIRAAGLFSYILTPKQRDQIKKLCIKEGWPVNQSKGITITISAIKHVLVGRTRKDGLTTLECAQLLSSAYSKHSEIALNKPINTGQKQERHEQVFILNAKVSARIQGSAFYCAAILQVSENELSQVTAYHTTWDKIKGITGR